MDKISRKWRILLIAILTVPICLYVAGITVDSHSRPSDVWLTVDENELAHVQATGGFSVQAVDRRGGIAVVRATEEEALKLSAEMHTDFNKCAGFIRHDSFDDALKTAHEHLSASGSQQLVDYTINNQAAVGPMLGITQEAQVRQTIADLSGLFTRRHDQQGGTDGANMIYAKWRALAQGRSDISVMPYAHLNANGDFITPQPSIILTINGTEFPNEIVVIGAHQDSINTSGATLNAPGADDDASGIASITEVIRVIKQTEFRPKRTIQFMAYAAEEIGLVGSKNIADNYRLQNKNVIGVLQLDMTDYKGPTSDIAMITDNTNAAQNQFVRDLITTYQPSLVVVDSTCGYGCSDHASWHNKQYAASMPFEAKYPTEYNRALHTVNDTLAQLGNNASHALKFAKLAVSFAGELAKGSIAAAQVQQAAFDYDGDGKSDVSVFRPTDAVWHINGSTTGYQAARFGIPTDVLTPADYDGDNKTDISVYRDGIWHLMNSTDGYHAFAWGVAGDIPQPGDYDGDRKSDPAVFRPSDGNWYVLKSSGGYSIFGFGLSGDRPTSADYDGDGKTDAAVYRDGIWHILGSVNGYTSFQFGVAADQPMTGDFNGDHKAEPSVFRNGIWYIRQPSENAVIFQWGISGDIPSVGDYDGDGKADPAVYRSGIWYIANSSNGSVRIEQFGLGGDVPTPASFLP